MIDCLIIFETKPNTLNQPIKYSAVTIMNASASSSQQQQQPSSSIGDRYVRAAQVQQITSNSPPSTVADRYHAAAVQQAKMASSNNSNK